MYMTQFVFSVKKNMPPKQITHIIVPMAKANLRPNLLQNVLNPKLAKTEQK